MMIEGRMVERRVGIDVECSMIVRWREVVVSVLFRNIVVGDRSCAMPWFDAWEDRLVLCGIVRMNFG